MKSSVNTRLTPRSLKKFVRPDKPLQIALLEAMKMELSEAVEHGDFDSGKATPLHGHELGYESWLRTYAPHAASSDLAEHHHRAWKWAESLQQGTSPQALIECWFRGGGKSTTMELIVSRLAVKATRRFAVYVCATQDAADRHVSDIATAMERCGIERAINKYGFSRGWNASKLRTANGFNVLAFGLDTGARGVKLDHLRPDMIILDDIDALDDSVNGVEKKIKTITQTILPAKSTDCAIVFVQNRIHANSVMSHVLSGELDMLQNRIQSPIVPAIENLQYTAFERDDGRVGYKIDSGTPTWSHKSVEVCQAEIDTYGLLAFLRECQHEVGVGGLFFSDFKEYDSTGKPWHVIDHVEVQPWWRLWGSHDFGTGAPACFILYASDERENVYVIGEVYESGLVSSEQAKKVLQYLQTRGYGSPKDKGKENGQWNTKLEAVAFDWANTFPPMNAAERIGEYPVEVWWEMNIPAVRAVKDRKAGWRRVKEWIAASEYVEGDLRPKLQIVRGAAPNLIKQLSNTMANPRDPEDIDNGTKNDHAIDSFRYGVMWREYPVRCPETEEADRVGKKYVPTWMKNKRDGETKWI